MKKKKIRNFLKQVIKLEKTPGSYSHCNGWADVYHAPFYKDETIERLQIVAKKLLKRLEEEE